MKFVLSLFWELRYISFLSFFFLWEKQYVLIYQEAKFIKSQVHCQGGRSPTGTPIYPSDFVLQISSAGFWEVGREDEEITDVPHGRTLSRTLSCLVAHLIWKKSRSAFLLLGSGRQVWGTLWIGWKNRVALELGCGTGGSNPVTRI